MPTTALPPRSSSGRDVSTSPWLDPRMFVATPRCTRAKISQRWRTTASQTSIEAGFEQLGRAQQAAVWSDIGHRGTSGRATPMSKLASAGWHIFTLIIQSPIIAQSRHLGRITRHDDCKPLAWRRRYPWVAPGRSGAGLRSAPVSSVNRPC